jgi:transcriptional regulator with XRE-family HTH domain
MLSAVHCRKAAAMAAFPQRLRQVREAAGLSQNALGRRIDINPGTINLLETGEREPTGREQVLQLAAGIGLDSEQTNGLVAAAGFAPPAYDAIGLANPTLLQVAAYLGGAERSATERAAFLQLLGQAMAGPLDPVLSAAVDILSDERIPAAERREFRLQIALAARRWRAVPLEAGGAGQ